MTKLKNTLLASFFFFAGNLLADDTKKMMEPALGGYCPVCYVAKNVAAKGTDEFKAEHNGETYLFVSKDALDAFNATPEKFLPAYDGYCAYGMSLGKKFESDPTAFSVIDGKIYLNKDADIQKLFKKNTKGAIVKADRHWKALEMKEKAMMEKEMKEKEMKEKEMKK